MATFQSSQARRWRAQVRMKGVRRSQAFSLSREAVDRATQIEAQATRIVSSGFHAVPAAYGFRPKLLVSDLVTLLIQDFRHRLEGLMSESDLFANHA